MTIIQPNKNTNRSTIAIAVISTAIVATFIMGVVVYADTVNMKHEISLKEKSIEEVKLKNTETQSILYKMLDAENLERLASEEGLIKDPAPKYLETKQSEWVFASQY